MLEFNATTRRAATTRWQPGLVALAALLALQMGHAAAWGGDSLRRRAQHQLDRDLRHFRGHTDTDDLR